MSRHPYKWRPRNKKLEWLRANVDHVVVLARATDSDLESGLPEMPEYHHWEMVDSHVDVDDRIPSMVVPQVAGWLRDGERVLVSCLMGRSRSGMTAALVVREYYGMTGEQALDYVRERRPNAIKRERPEAWIRGLGRPD